MGGFCKDYPLDAVLRAGLATRTEQIEAADRIEKLEAHLNASWNLAVKLKDKLDAVAKIPDELSNVRLHYDRGPDGGLIPMDTGEFVTWGMVAKKIREALAEKE